MRKSSENIKAFVGHVWDVSMEKVLKSEFQNGGGIILLQGAPVESNFDGIKSPKLRCS